MIIFFSKVLAPSRENIKLYHHLIRDLVNKEDIWLKFISINDQFAYFPTKTIALEKIESYGKK